MFEGAAALSLDAKGRMAIPARHRDSLLAAGEGALVLTAHPHHCLLLYPAPAWQPIRDQVLKASASIKLSLDQTRAGRECPHRGARFGGPPAGRSQLRSYANLEKTVYLSEWGAISKSGASPAGRSKTILPQEVLSGDLPPGLGDLVL